MKYSDLMKDFKENPREISTAPKSGHPKWFYTFVNNDIIYVKSANLRRNMCNIKTPRRLNPNECETVFCLYQKRNTTPISKEIKSITHNASYWFGIFEDYFDKNMERM